MTIDRVTASSQIDEIRETLTLADSEDRVLVGIVRDLWDGYPIEDAKDAARYLTLSDYDAEKRIKAILKAVR